ncbi:MAG TPA: ABC transporter ATP-binding protein [Polyangiales bacterium]|nr:ABC transporter ATP-binding protein [Polyangiales bacterium]
MSNVVSVRGLRKQYGDVRAVDDVSFEIEPGHILALLGANGAGKSTTVHMLLGLVAASAGTIEIAGHDVARDPSGVRRASAYVPDRLALYPHLTGLENLTYFHQVGDGPALTRAQLEAVLERVGLDRAAFDRRASTYSKGMCQKVGLAIALAKEARALFLDEPLSGLDPKAANEFCAKLREVADAGAGVLMATHDLFRAHDTADEIGIMRDGKLVKTLRTSEIDAAGLEHLYLEQMR